jgi:hypothetical protein
MAEMIFSKKILNVRAIDLTPYIHRRQALVNLSEGMNGTQGEKKVKKESSSWKKEVRSLDEFTAPIVLLHSKAV